MSLRPMLPDEYAKALERLGFSNRGFCIWIGVTERAGRLWKSGDAPVPATLAAFLRLALRLKLSAARLREILERA